jgi:hypothetical protein
MKRPIDAPEGVERRREQGLGRLGLGEIAHIVDGDDARS